MTIIEQLERRVSLPILGDKTSIAYISVLEQFYALLIARLASAEVYTQLLQSAQPPVAPQASPLNDSLLMQIWPDNSQRQFIIDELAATYYTDKTTTARLITSAAALAYHELKELANGQFLPAFLQQAQIRYYLPVWAKSVLIDETHTQVGHDTPIDDVAAHQDIAYEDTAHENTVHEGMVHEDRVNKAAVNKKRVNKHTSRNPSTDESTESTDTTLADTAIDETSSAPSMLIEDSAQNTPPRGRSDKRYKKNDIRLWLLLFIIALIALAVLWWLMIRPSSTDKPKPTVAAPTTTVIESKAEPEANAPVLTPVELLVAVDDSGSLYTCSATVGDDALQQSLKQAFVMSFGEQADICELTIAANVASSLADINIGLLPSIFGLLRSAPFARLQLQNDIITIETPNDELSQRLLTDMQALMPATTIITNAPLVTIQNSIMTAEKESMRDNDTAPNNHTQRADSQNAKPQHLDQQSIAQSNNDAINQETSYQAIDDSDYQTQRATTINSNNMLPNNRATSGVSEAEVYELANRVIVAEQLRNESRIKSDLATEE